jgi:predicted nuclease with TOPRIM domain
MIGGGADTRMKCESDEAAVCEERALRLRVLELRAELRKIPLHGRVKKQFSNLLKLEKDPEKLEPISEGYEEYNAEASEFLFELWHLMVYHSKMAEDREWYVKKIGDLHERLAKFVPEIWVLHTKFSMEVYNDLSKEMKQNQIIRTFYWNYLHKSSQGRSPSVKDPTPDVLL